MTLIHQITEDNWQTERLKGQQELEQKFSNWDKLANTTPDDFITQSRTHLQDPTIYAYAHFYDDQGNKLRFYPFQDKIVNDKHRFIHVTAANQIGKTACVCVKAIHHAVNTKNASVIIVSKSEQQSNRVLDVIKKYLKFARISFKEVIGDVENRKELHLDILGGTSTICSFPPTGIVLGYPATLLILDEVGFWERLIELTPSEYYEQVLEPRTNATKHWTHPFLTMGQIIAISNPNGKQGLHYKLYNDERYHHYKYCYLARPTNTLEEYQSARKRLEHAPHRFASIYAAEYIDASGGFITTEMVTDFEKHDLPLQIPPGTTIFLGADFAGEDSKSKQADHTALIGVKKTIINKVTYADLCYHQNWPPQTPRKVIYEEIKRIKNLPGVNIAKFAYDKVGIGDSVKNDLIDAGILAEPYIEPLTYSLPNKSDVYLNLKAALTQGTLRGRHIPQLHNELLGLRTEQPEGSVHLKIHHATEGTHDDEVDSLANSVWAATRTLTAIPHIEIFPRETIQEWKTRTEQPRDKPKTRYLAICTKCPEYDQYHTPLDQTGLTEHYTKKNCPMHPA